MTRVAWSALVATLLGIAAAAWAIHGVGVGILLGAVRRIGPLGFLLYVLTTLPSFVALGFAWASGMRGGARDVGAFAWARAVREAASDLLPFSQIGGLVLGTEALVAAGVDRTAAYVATIVDLSTEMVAQLVLTLFGLSILAALLKGAADRGHLHHVAIVGVAGMAGLIAAFLLLQRPALRLAARLAGRLLPAAGDAIDAVRAELIAFGERPAALVAPFLWNLAAWLLTILSSWVALTLLGATLPPLDVLALETLIFALRSGAFLIPGALGVQEAGYVLLAPAFGIDAETALALSLVKRARDLGIGALVLAIGGSRWRARRGARIRGVTTEEP